MKTLLLLLVLSISTSLLALNDSQWMDALQNSGLTFRKISISKDGRYAAGLLSNFTNFCSKEGADQLKLNKNTLCYFEKKQGDFTLSANLNLSNFQGAFRPTNFPKNEYIYYVFVDVTGVSCREFNRVSDIPFANRETNREGVRDFRNEQIIYYDKNGIRESRRPTRVYRFTRQRHLRRLNLNGDLQICEPIENLFWKGNSIYLFYDNLTAFSVLQLNGEISSQQHIDYTFPKGMAFDKSHEIVQDKVTEEFYFVVATNFSYLWYELDEENQSTRLLKKFNDVWVNPNWDLSMGLLNYQYLRGNRYEQMQEVLK
jgi:hypothetical protein